MTDERLGDLLRVDVSGEPTRRRGGAPEVSDHEPRRRFPIGIVMLWCAGILLAGAGVRIVANSTTGSVVDRVDDPDAPGFEALVDATPTLALLSVHGEDLTGIAILTLPHGDAGGGVVLVPQRTIDDLAVFGRGPLDVSFAFGTAASLTDALGVLVGFGIPEHAVVDDGRWAELVGPVAPIVVDNPNELSVDGEVAFEIGEIELEADEVGPYLRATVESESDLERLYRHKLFYTAWIEAVAAHGGVDAVPGELDSGVGSFVRTLAAGEVEVATLPVEVDESDEFAPPEAYVMTDDAADLLERMVPFPTSAEPGARARIRVLNGTRDTSQASLVAPLLPPAGVEVVTVGNAVTLDASQTSIRYTLPEFEDQALAVADILGVDDVQLDDRVSDSYDITVTLGPDASSKT